MKIGILIRCDLCKAEIRLFEHEAAKEGWDWFTGTLKRPYHFCPTCKDSAYRHSLFEAAMQFPKSKGRGRPPKEQP